MPPRSPLPFVYVNMAISADAKIASADRRLTSFGSPRDEQHLYELRTGADAIFCGARTIEQSRSTLGNGGPEFTRRRVRAGRAAFPLRVVVTGSGSLSREAEIWRRDYGPILVVTTPRAPSSALRWFRAQAAGVFVSEGPEVDWTAVLDWLGRTHGVKQVLSEGGGELNDALFRAGVVQEMHLTWCPWLIGGSAAPTVADGQGHPRLAEASLFRLARRRRVGSEYFLVFRVGPALPLGVPVRRFVDPAARPLRPSNRERNFASAVKSRMVPASVPGPVLGSRRVHCS